VSEMAAPDGPWPEPDCYDRVHPCDREKLRRLGELLFDIAAGRLMTRDVLVHPVRQLMVCTRPDCCADAADEVVDRLLAVADCWPGADGMAEAALVEIWDGPGGLFRQ
jgi:hypothetical protein